MKVTENCCDGVKLYDIMYTYILIMNSKLFARERKGFFMALLPSLVRTNDMCVGCNRCISVCPVLNANVTVMTENGPRIEVNRDACINCGSCFDACDHHARTYDDDTERFFADLKAGKRFPLSLRRLFLRIIRKNTEVYWAA